MSNRPVSIAVSVAIAGAFPRSDTVWSAVDRFHVPGEADSDELIEAARFKQG